MNPAQLSHFIRSSATELGFLGVGFSQAERLDREARKLESWLQKNHHGSMQWMSQNFEKRVDPRKLVPGAKSVISFIYNYHAPKQQPPDAPKVASYAYGRDYHKVIRKKLKELFARIVEQVGSIEGRCFVDSAPVMERQWAQRAGLGWLGKNTLLLHPKQGSYFFLAEIISDLEVEADHPIRDHCGTCTACIDACPTDAISENGYLLDASKCISYLTIERKDDIPSDFRDQMEGWVFGCDICQEVCPWNRFSRKHQEPQFEPGPGITQLSREDWYEMTEELFDELFRGTPLKRAKYEGIRRNLKFLATKKG